MAISLVIVNARIPTGDPRRPWADAIAIEGDRVVVISSSAEVMKLSAGARVIDAKGASLGPGDLKVGMRVDLDRWTAADLR